MASPASVLALIDAAALEAEALVAQTSVPPTISNARVEPPLLPAGGGRVTIHADIAGAHTVTLNGAVIGLPWVIDDVTDPRAWVLRAEGPGGTTAVTLSVQVAAPPAAPTERINVSFAQTDTEYASKALHAKWESLGGDWYDRDGELNGPQPTRQVRAAAPGEVSVDITGFGADLLLREGWIVDDVRLDGAPADAFWTDPSSNKAWRLPTRSGQPIIVVNRAGARTLTCRMAYAGTLRVDRLAAPEVASLPYLAAQSPAPADLLELDMTSEVAIRAQLGFGAISTAPDGFAFDPEFGVDPAGIRYLRFAARTSSSRLLHWIARFRASDEAYCRYLLWIEEEVADGMTERGMKLPGLASSATLETLSWRMEHGAVDGANRGLYALLDYCYNAESGQGYPPIRSMGGGVLRAGGWHVIEQGARINSIGGADGWAEVRLNGHAMWRRNAVNWRMRPTTQWDHLFVNVWHGGLGLPSRPFHYRIAKVAASSRGWLGVPPELLAAA